ncbi:uncharacterized protein MONBRDRAFT_5446 [Monosiga brevicollis MX1]|uniref:Protein root UVB sensitive/RUS domain-containing protein n=1 Tax=Monosiga brevicollis TaxID=81824 RepID=A9UR04_MONBE|nr:uncharacterized protein MONBRDRAFT_5446 [Monosiga brevicollis MX1]EDQ93134.1 predicted protein [Monosiga brevicollis MX1]|eukprot:XP_001742896.1 hypothetical protein [Monosiga brevicollis MX1]
MTASGVLSMQALLYAAGLGAGSVPLAAAINWVLKDGLGQLGGVLYGTLFGPRFDRDPKRQRFWSLVALQGANLTELLIPLVPHLFLPLASAANIAKNISFLASSATRAQMHASFVRRANLGDITAKIGAQSIGASVVGTALGIFVSTHTGSDVTNIIPAFVPLALACLYFNHLSSKHVVLSTLNEQRLELAMHPWLQDLASPDQTYGHHPPQGCGEALKQKDDVADVLATHFRSQGWDLSAFPVASHRPLQVEPSTQYRENAVAEPQTRPQP